MITLTPMPSDRHPEWARHLWTSYRAELIRAGSSEASADDNMAQNKAETMPGGQLAAGQYVFEAWSDNQRVGVVWLAERADEWFIYDLEIDAECRRRGLGRETLRAAEEWVRQRGGTILSLSVFGFNDIAQRLYGSEGFETVRMSMTKRLT